MFEFCDKDHARTSKTFLLYTFSSVIIWWRLRPLWNWYYKEIWSSLIYNTSARHERHEFNTSAERATRVQHECHTNGTCTTLVKNFDFDNDTSENIFWNPCIYYRQVKDYKERNNFVLRTTFWKCHVPMPKFVWKVHRKNWIL